ncbi:MAG: DUF2726 domain-containing protein [Burkholderiaceae bacterium]|nr:DUF2726 domain-containing protein [Burkholderiaceae bacterium]
MNQRLLNGYEEVTYEALCHACRENGAKVFPKVRVADVLRLEGSGVASEHFSFGLRSHFDFVVTAENYDPLFSVEFDGPLHKTSEIQRHRDNMKNELCDHFDHPLLRINSNYLSKTYRGLDLLTYFVEAWFLEKAFNEAQQAGHIPYDEPFDMASFYSAGGNGKGKKWPYWISLDIQLSLQKLHAAGSIGQSVPSHIVGIDSSGTYRCLSWLVFDAASVIEVSTGMRTQRFPAVCESDLVSMLAMFDMMPKVEAALHGDRTHLQDREKFFAERLPAFQGKYSMRSSLSVGATV